MMGFTADGQSNPAMISARDRDLNIDPANVKTKRSDLPAKPVAAGADAWRKGEVYQLDDTLLEKQASAEPGNK